MNKQKKSSAYLLFWFLAVFTSINLWLTYTDYRQQVSRVTTIKSRLLQCNYIVKATKYPCLYKVKGLLLDPSTQPLVASSGLCVITFLFAVFVTISHSRQNKKDESKDFLDVLIGSKHSQDLLGEMYQMSYLYKEKKVSPKNSYLFSLLDDCVRRITVFYGLTPTGNPGDGPIPYNKEEHIAYGHILPNEQVWVAQVGWKKGGKIFLPSMVSKNSEQHLDGDWQ